MSARDQWKLIHVLNTCKPGGLTTIELDSLAIRCYYDTIIELIDSNIIQCNDRLNGPFWLHPIAQKIINTFIVCRGDRTKTDIYVDSPSCFVIMPFNESWSDKVYTEIIEPAIVNSGLKCIRGDEIDRVGALNSTIFMSLQKAGIIIADISVPNPNVYYELGVADTLGKEVFVITQSIHEQKIAADKVGVHYLTYDLLSPDSSKKLLTEALIQWTTLNNLLNTPMYSKVP